MKLLHLFLLKFSDKVSACLEELKTSPYSGTVSVTNQGQPCQAWSSQIPHNHTDNKDGIFPLDGSVKKARNYCRDLSGSGKPGCYTTDPLIVWGFCHLRICNGKLMLAAHRCIFVDSQLGAVFLYIFALSFTSAHNLYSDKRLNDIPSFVLYPKDYFPTKIFLYVI